MAQQKLDFGHDFSQTGYPNVLIYQGTRYPFDPHNVIYGTPKKTAHGGYKIDLTYLIKGTLADGTPVERSVPIVLQTPTMTTTFGFSSKEMKDGKVKGNVDLTFYENMSDAARIFKQVLHLWDQLLLERAKKQKVQWFKSNKVTDDILTYLYNPLVRENVRKSDGKQFADSFRLKIPRRGDRFDVEVWDANKNPIALDEITRGCSVRGLVRHNGIWFGDSMFCSSFETQQLQKQGDGRPSGFSFVPDDEDDEMTQAVSPGSEGGAMLDDDEEEHKDGH